MFTKSMSHNTHTFSEAVGHNSSLRRIAHSFKIRKPNAWVLTCMKKGQTPMPVCRRLCPQLCTPSHALAPPTLALHTLGHMQIHIASIAPTSFATAMPSTLPPALLLPEHHPATIQPVGPQRCATGGPGAAGRRCSTMGKGFVCDHRRYFEVERVCLPSWAARAPHNFVL